MLRGPDIVHNDLALWRVPDHTDAVVDELGRVYRLIGSDLIPNTVYQSVTLSGKRVWVHSVAARAFYGDPPHGSRLVRHLDGDGSNNAASNLRYGTQQDNANDSKSHGKSRRVKAALTKTWDNHAVYTQREETLMLTLDDAGYTASEIASQLNRSRGAIYDKLRRLRCRI